MIMLRHQNTGKIIREPVHTEFIWLKVGTSGELLLVW